jgi:hypothetical protein
MDPWSVVALFFPLFDICKNNAYHAVETHRYLKKVGIMTMMACEQGFYSYGTYAGDFSTNRVNLLYQGYSPSPKFWACLHRRRRFFAAMPLLPPKTRVCTVISSCKLLLFTQLLPHDTSADKPSYFAIGRKADEE